MKISSVSKKVLASALSAAMVVAFAPTVAFAAPGTYVGGVSKANQDPSKTYVATVTTAGTGDVYYYETLHAALNESGLSAGDTVSLLADIAIADAAESQIVVATDATWNTVLPTNENKLELLAGGKDANGVQYYTNNPAKVADAEKATQGVKDGGTFYTLKKADVAASLPTVTNATKAKYDNLKAGNSTYTVPDGVNFDGKGHKITVETVKGETVVGADNEVPDVDSFEITFTGATGQRTLKDVALVDATANDVKGENYGKSTADPFIDAYAGQTKAAQTSEGTAVPGLTISGVTADKMDVTATAGTVSMSATVKEVAVQNAANAVTITGGTYDSVSNAGTLYITGGTFNGGKTTAGSVLNDATLDNEELAKGNVVYKFPKDLADEANDVVEVAVKASNKTYYTNTVVPAVVGATKISGGDFKGFVIESAGISGGTFAQGDVTAMMKKAAPTQATNTLATNYATVEGKVVKGIGAADIALFDTTSNINDVAGTDNKVIKASKAAVTAKTSSVIAGLATDSALYKKMYGDAPVQASVEVKAEVLKNFTAVASSQYTAAQAADMAIVEAAKAAASKAGCANVDWLQVDKDGAFKAQANANKCIQKVSASMTAGTEEIALAEFGAVTVTAGVATADANVTDEKQDVVYTVLFSADGKEFTAVATGLSAKNGAVEFTADKAGYYAVAYSASLQEQLDEAKKQAEADKATIAALQDEIAAMKATGKSKTVKLNGKSKTAKKQTVTLKAVASDSGATMTFKKSSGSSKVSVAKSGKATLKKGVKKGTYTAKVKATVGASSKTVTVKFVVKA